MPDFDASMGFSALRQRMLKAGVASNHAQRIVEELRDHLDDIRDESGASDISSTESINRLGDPAVILQQVLSRPELKSWVYRYPRIARAYLPMEYVLLLPLAPIYSGIRSVSTIARWGAAFFLSAAVTAGMLLMMQLSITLT